jgi:hypothetical protein
VNAAFALSSCLHSIEEDHKGSFGAFVNLEAQSSSANLQLSHSQTGRTNLRKILFGGKLWDWRAAMGYLNNYSH